MERSHRLQELIAKPDVVRRGGQAQQQQPEAGEGKSLDHYSLHLGAGVFQCSTVRAAARRLLWSDPLMSPDLQYVKQQTCDLLSSPWRGLAWSDNEKIGCQRIDLDIQKRQGLTFISRNDG